MKVKWTRVPDLIERRRIFLKGGWAYVPSREQSSIVFQEFETRLDKALEVSLSGFCLQNILNLALDDSQGFASTR